MSNNSVEYHLPLSGMEPAPYAFHRGKLIEFSKATVPLYSVAVLEAFTVFDLMVACWNHKQGQLYVHRLDRHCKRLVDSAKIVGLPPTYGVDFLKQAVMNTLRRNAIKGKDITIRILVYRSEADEDSGGVGLTVLCHIRNGPFGRDIEAREIWAGSRRRIPDNALPARAKASANYENGRITHGDFYLNMEGKVSEFLTASVFAVRDGVAVTPGLQSDQLESITRDTFIKLLTEVHGIPVQTRNLDRSELYLADEMWGGASGTGIFPIRKVDGRLVGTDELAGEPGPVFTALRSTFHAVHYGTTDLYPEWLTGVY